MARSLLIRGGHVVSLDPSIGELPRGDVLVEDGVIAAVGAALHAPHAETIEAAGQIVMPGFVDSHRHTWQSQLRGLAVNCTAPAYRRGIRQRFGSVYRPADVHAGTLLGALEAIDSGITTLVDWAHVMNTPDHADAAIEALRDSGIRAVFAYGTPSDERGAEWYDHSQLNHPEDIRRVRSEHLPDDDGLVTLALGARPPHNATPSVIQHDWSLARELGIRITVDGVGRGKWGGEEHADITELHEAGLLGTDTTFVHCCQLSDRDLRLMSEHGASASISPEVEMNVGHGFPATGRLVAAGIRPALSVDVPAMVSGEMFSVMRATLAAERLRQTLAAAEDGGWIEGWTVDAADVLGFATLDGAVACGLGHRTGSLSPGKCADLILLREDGLNITPTDDGVAAVVCFAGVRDVDTVVVDGCIVKRNGRLLGDPRRAIDLATQSREYLAAAAAARPQSDHYAWKW